MKSGFLVLAITAGALGIPGAASAQGWDRDPYYDSRNSYQRSPVDRVMADLNRAFERARLDGHERRHFDDAARNLAEFRSRLARGRFDTGNLDRAIDSMKHLADADRVRGRDREMLARDIDELRQLRASRGRYSWR
jgi:hypothetical protein